MSETAAEQLRRILDVIPRIADGDEHAMADLASHAGVDLPTLIADLGSLAERFDVPGGFVEGVQVFIEEHRVSVTASHFLRPMRLTMPELCALELGLAMLRSESGDAGSDVIDRAMARLRHVITRLPANESHEGLRHADLAVSADPRHLATIRSALSSKRKVRLVYRRVDGSDSAGGTGGAGGSDVHERVICPYSLFFWSGMWYVVAHCERSEGIRFFRLDRITSATETDAKYAVASGFRLEAVLTDGRPLGGEPAGLVRVRYSPRIARWIAERERRALEPDGSLVLEHPMHDVDWAVRHVLQYGPDAEVLEPQSVRAALVERLHRMAV